MKCKLTKTGGDQAIIGKHHEGRRTPILAVDDVAGVSGATRLDWRILTSGV